MSAQPTGLVALVAVLEDLQEGKSFALASFILVVYEYFVTCDDEFRNFWSGSWSTSRVLYLINRYLTPAIVTLRLITDFFPEMFPSQFCHNSLQATFPLNIFAMAVIQGVLVVRLWYLFAPNRPAQVLLIGSFFVCTLGSVVSLGLVFSELQSNLVITSDGLGYYCSQPPSRNFTLVFVPGFMLYGVLSIFMLVRVVHNLTSLKDVPLKRRISRDGGFLYMMMSFSVTFTVSAAMLGVTPSIGVLAMLSNFMLAITSISISRVMTSINHLAHTFRAAPEPVLLINNAALNRAHWEKKMGFLSFIPPIPDPSLEDDDDPF